jgi:hypothetical protein
MQTVEKPDSSDRLRNVAREKTRSLLEGCDADTRGTSSMPTVYGPSRTIARL